MIPSASRFCTRTSIYRLSRLLLSSVVMSVPFGLISVTSPLKAIAAPQSEPIRYDATAHTFRIDAGDVSYILGVNESAICRHFIGASGCARKTRFLHRARRAARDSNCP